MRPDTALGGWKIGLAVAGSLWMWACSGAAIAQQARAPEAPSPVAPQQAPGPDHATLLRWLSTGEARATREAAEAIQRAPPQARDELLAIADAVKGALSTSRDLAAERALRLALGKLAAAGVEDAAEWGFESMSVTHSAKTPPEIFEAHVRALEMVPGAARELMIGNLDVAINLDVGEPLERQRIKEFVTLTAEAMRTRELSVFLDALLRGEEDLFIKLEAPLEARLIVCYRNVRADPPIKADAVLEWLDKHPGGPVEVDLAALETVSLVGTTKTKSYDQLAERLLAQRATAIKLARRLLSGHVDRSLLGRIREALQRHAASDDSGAIAKLLTELANRNKSAPELKPAP
jgi:hypothetical protein